jgi:hypothetical protein
MEVQMSEINGISNIENKNAYNINAGKKSSDSTDFSAYLSENKSLDDIFVQAADKYKVPVDLLKAIGKAESNFNTNAVSRCGAQGVMQLMPATAKELGVSNSFDAEQNIMGGAKYIAGLLKKYDGDTRLALAAYNAGSGNVAKYGGIPPFTETQNYVKKVMKYIGEDDVEIASSRNYTTGATSTEGVTGRSNTAKATPIRNNLSYLLTNNVNGTEGDILNLETLFSYEDYLKFVEMFLNEKEEKENKENNASYTAKDINYNAAVMNLLKDQNLI